jgi:hypothetical protein
MMRSTRGAGSAKVPLSGGFVVRTSNGVKVGLLVCFGLGVVGDTEGFGVGIAGPPPDGGVAGVALATEDAGLVFTTFTAETLKKYKDPLVRPVTVAEVPLLVPSAKVDQVELFAEYSTK